MSLCSYTNTNQLLNRAIQHYMYYVYNIDNQEKVKTIGTPITVTWKNTSKWQNYE